MPMPGDADLVVASELMEAGRAIVRGLVTADRTTLVASTHRVYSMTEKTAVADGRVASEALLEACRTTAANFIGFDMAAAAEANKSVISAVLLGAIAGSGALPFPASRFQDAIRESGVGVARSLAAFEAGHAAAQGAAPAPAGAPARPEPRAPAALAQEVRRHACGKSQAIILAGLEACADYQDEAYANLYWQRLLPFVENAEANGVTECELLSTAARQLAQAMTHPDTIRVAELKIRSSRFARIREELGLKPGEVLEVSEYMHPRIEEIAETLPSAIGRWLLRSSFAGHVLGQFTSRGRIVRTTSPGGFLMLYAIASMKPWRRRSLRFAKDNEYIEEWLDMLWAAAKRDLKLAVSLGEARGLLRGYGETLETGHKKFHAICDFVKSKAQVTADEVRALTAAAQAGDGTEALERALANLKTTKRKTSSSLVPAK